MAKVEVQVLAHMLNVRKTASTSATIVSVIKKNEKYVSSKQNGQWYWIDAKNGWTSMGTTTKYLKVVRNLATATPSTPTPTQKPKPPSTSTSKPATDYSITKKIIDEGDVAFAIFNVGNNGTVSGLKLAEEATGLKSFNNNQRFPKVYPGTNVLNYGTDYSMIEDNLKTIRKNMNVSPNQFQIRDSLSHQFNRFKTAFPDYHLNKSFSHVFFTRPDLNLFNGMAGKLTLSDQVKNDPLFYFLFNNYAATITALSQRFTTDHPFIPFLSNAANSFEVGDEFIKTQEHGETLTGYKLQYGMDNIQSNTAGTFIISYTDDMNFSIYKIHKAWIEYISKVYRGEISPGRHYILRRIIDYACSAYYFVCGPDGETILFWSKYFGVFPTNTPASASSWSRGSSVKMPEFNINYAYAFKEDYNPLSLAEFNLINRDNRLNKQYKKMYEPILAQTGIAMSGAPFIETVKDAYGRYQYKLRFAKN